MKLSNKIDMMFNLSTSYFSGYYLPTLVILVTSSLYGCSSVYKIKDLNDYQPVALNRAEIGPDDSLLNTRSRIPKVLILSLREGNYPSINWDRFDADSKQFLLDKLSDKLHFVTNASADEKQRLQNDIQLQQAYSGGLNADFALIGRIKDINSTSQFVEDTEIVQYRGKMVSTYCLYSTTIKYEVQVYRFPRLQMHTSINISHTIQTKSDLIESRVIASSPNKNYPMFDSKLNGESSKLDSHCPFNHELLQSHINSAAGEMLTGSTDYSDGILQSTVSRIANLMSPLGIIIEKRMKGDLAIFKTNLGKASGISPDTQVAILELSSKEDLGECETHIDKCLVGKARLTNLIHSGESWIAIDDRAVSNKIKKGDIIKVQYQSGKLGGIN